MSLAIEDVGRRPLAQIAREIGLPLARWHHECALIAPAIARAYALHVGLLQLANDGTGDQRYHVMLITADDRVLDALECQARQGRDPVDCSDWLPFVGQRATWGQARGFDAQDGSIVDVPRRPRWTA